MVTNKIYYCEEMRKKCHVKNQNTKKKKQKKNAGLSRLCWYTFYICTLKFCQSEAVCQFPLRMLGINL